MKPKNKIKMPTLDQKRIDQTKVNTKTGTSREAKRFHAMVKNKPVFMRVNLRFPELIFQKLNLLKLVNRRSFNQVVVDILESGLEDPELKKRMKSVPKILKKIKI